MVCSVIKLSNCYICCEDNQVIVNPSDLTYLGEIKRFLRAGTTTAGTSVSTAAL